MIIMSLQLHFLLMASILFLDLITRQSDFGVLRQVRVLCLHSKAMMITLLQLHLLLCGSAFRSTHDALRVSFLLYLILFFLFYFIFVFEPVHVLNN